MTSHEFAGEPMQDITYPRLVSASYLLLAAIRDPKARLTRAQRLAASALAQHMGKKMKKMEDSDELFWSCLAPMVRRIIGSRSRFLFSWTNWARIETTPGDVEQVVLEAHLAAASPHARLGYLLLVAEDLSPEIAARHIKALEIRFQAHPILDAGAALRDQLVNDGVSVLRQREIIAEPESHPALSTLKPPTTTALRARSMVRRTLPVVGAVAVIFASLIIVQVLDQSKRPHSHSTPTALSTVKRVDATAAPNTAKLELAAWPTRGSMAGDQNLTDRAMRAWSKATKAGEAPAPAQQVQLLYAGAVKSQTVVALTDGQRVARYIDQKGSIKVDPIPRSDVYGSSSLALADGPEGTTYLLAPWVTAAKAASGTDWTPLAVTDGLTDPVRKSSGGRCGPHSVLQLRARGVDDAFAVADFGRVAMTYLTYVPPKAPAGRNQDVDPTVGRTLSRISCQLGDENAEQLNAITVWVVWSGKLPESTGTGSVLCVRAARAGGKSTVTTSLLAGGSAPATTMGQIAGGQACGGDQDVVVAGWYQAPNGAWYYIATGSRKVSDITVAGGQIPNTSGDGLVAHGPFTERKQTDFSVTAKGPNGSTVAILR